MTHLCGFESPALIVKGNKKGLEKRTQGTCIIM